MLDQTFWGNSVQDWLIALAVAVAVQITVYVVLRFALARFRRLARRTANDVDDLVAELLDKTKFVVIALVSIWAGSLYLDLSETADEILEHVLVIGVIVQGAYWANGLITWGLKHYRRTQLDDDPGMVTALGAIGFIVRVGVLSVFLLMALTNLGVEIGPLIASLGVGGLAVALALQTVLGDLFASLSIVFDKPFEVGDFIQVGEYRGTVEHVGLKTSRVRALSGEQLVFNNSDLLGARVQNYKRLEERRISFQIGVTYDTPRAQLEEIPGMIREMIESKEQTRFDRCHLMTFGDSALIFDIVFYMLVPDYAVYADVQHAVNLELIAAFEEKSIDFAYPTQTLYVHDVGGAAPTEVANGSPA